MSAAALPLGHVRSRRAARALDVLIAGLLAVLVLGVGLRAAGMTVLVDYTDSMRPAIAAGDLVIDRDVPAGRLRPGQIATIEDPVTRRLVTHRVMSVTAAGEQVTVVTRGDANDASERWVLPAGRTVRRVAARAPWVGHLVLWLASPLLRALVLLGAALALAGWGLLRLRRPA